MNRRDFMNKFSAKAALASAGVAAATAATYPKIRQGATDGAQKLAGEVRALSRRIDDMEESQRRTVRLLITVVSISTGFDAIRLINGDWL